jgi:23S rRNA (adenine2503-C2)-methyltransferase
MTTRENLLNLTPDDAEVRLAAFMSELGQPGYRVGQVVRRLWANPVRSFEDMTELPAALRASLA